MQEESNYTEKENKGLLDFMNSVKKVKNHRIHKVRNSYGVYDGFKFYRKTRPKDHKYALTESQYFSIIRSVNKLLGELLINGDDIVLPCRLGRLELRKYKANITIDDKKIRTNLPINWDETLKLWYEDEESFKNRTLVKTEEQEVYKVYYNKIIANFKNKCFYRFKINKELKKCLKKNIKEGKVDAFIIGKKITL